MNKHGIMTATTMSHSYLEVILGPMFSGKTSKIIELYKQFKYCNIGTMVINHVWDKRYDDTLLSSHDRVKIECVSTESLMSVFDAASAPEVQVVLINEGQFFGDLYEFVSGLLALPLPLCKKIYVAGLDGDSERKRFGQILDLVPLCDRVYKMSSICSKCRDGTEGIFSMRLTAESEQVVIGSDMYAPVCRGCFVGGSVKK